MFPQKFSPATTLRVVVVLVGLAAAAVAAGWEPVEVEGDELPQAARTIARAMVAPPVRVALTRPRRFLVV
jgi:hypothetical protein